MIWVGLLGIVGRLVASWMSDAFGRRASGFVIGMGGAICMALAGYCYDLYIGTASVFFLLIMAQRFFGDASYAIIGPYIAEVWPNRLRASGMGFSYGIGNLGKVIGPLGLALIVGSSNTSPPSDARPIFPLVVLAFWYAKAGLTSSCSAWRQKRAFDRADRRAAHERRQAPQIGGRGQGGGRLTIAKSSRSVPAGVARGASTR